MRKALIQSVTTDAPFSFENLSVESYLGANVTVSLEEEVVALQEATEMQSDLDSDLEAASRSEGVSDTMLDMAETVDEAGEVTPAQANLIDTASEMAVAGTDVDPDDVIPSVADQIENPEFSVESFTTDLRKRAEDLWKRIREYVATLWAQLMEIFSRLFVAIPRNLARIKSLRDAVDAKKKAAGDASPKLPQVQIVMGNASLSYNGYIVKDTAELNKGLVELKKLGDYAFGQYPRQVKVQGDIVASALKSFNPKEAQKCLGEVVSKMAKANFVQVATNPSTGYMGDFDLHTVRLNAKNLTGLQDAQVLNALQHTKVVVQARAASTMGMHMGANNKFETMKYTDMYTTLSNSEALLKQIAAFQTSADSKAMTKVKDDLLAGGDHAKQAIAALAGGDQAGNSEREFALDVMKSLMNFSTTFTRWSGGFTPVVIRKLINSTKASLVLVEKSLAQY